MSKNFIVPLVIYPFDVMFSIGETDKQLRKTLKRVLPKEAYQICIEDDVLLKFDGNDSQKGRALLIINYWQTIIRFGKNPSHGTISHEIFHAVEFLFSMLNMPLCRKNDEAYAYVIGYLTNKLYKEARIK